MVTDLTEGIPQSDANPLEAELFRPWEEQERARLEELGKWKSAQRSRLDEAVMDWDKATAGKEIALDFAADQETAKKQAIVESFLHIENDGEDFRSTAERDGLRDRYAYEHLEGRGVGDDLTFYAEVEKHTRTRKAEADLLEGTDEASSRSSLRGRIQQAALTGGDWRKQFLEWDRVASKDKRYIRGNRTRYEESARIEYEHLTEVIDEARPYADEAFKGLLHEKENLLVAYGGNDAVRAIMKAPADLQPAVMALVVSKAQEEGAKQEAGGHAWRTFGRGSGKQMVIGPAKTMFARQLIEAEKILSEIKPGDEFGGRFKSLTHYAMDASKASRPETQPFWFLAEPVLKNNIATAEGIEKAKKNLGRLHESFRIRNQLEQIAQGTLDPLKSSNWFGQKIGYPFLSSVAPSIASVVVTRRLTGSGLGAIFPMWGSMAHDNAQQYLAQNPGMSFTMAYELGQEAAVYQSGLEYAETMLSLGSGKLLGNALRTAEASAFTTFGKSAVKGLFAQNLLEGGQDLLPYIVQELDSEAPAANAARFFYGKDGEPGYWTQRIDTFWAMLPAVAMGAGGSTLRAKATRTELEEIAAITRDEPMLKAAGIPAGVRTAIIRETDPVARLNKFGAALQLADPDIAMEGQAELEARRASMEAAQAEARQSGDIPIVTGNQEKGYTIRDAKTGELLGEAKDPDEALRIASLHTEMLNEERKHEVAYFGSLLEASDLASAGKTKEGDESTFDIGPGSLMSTREAELLSPGAEQRQVDQASLHERLTGGDGKTLWSILGLSITDMQALKQDVRKTVNYLRNGATVREVIHEKTHGFRREARARGRLTRDDEVAFVRAYDSIVRDKQTRGADGTHTQLAFLPDGIADTDITYTMLDEAISEIMEVELMRMARRGSRRGQADSARAEGIGTASRVSVKNITAALKLLSPAAAQRFSHFMEAARSYFGLVFGRTAAINKAQRDGKFDQAGADAFIGKLFGIDGQDAHDTPAAEALREILDISPAAFSHRGVKPLPFAENVAKAIAGKLPANAILDFGSPSPVLLQAGVPDLPMLIRLGKMREKAKKHPELTREILEGLPHALQNPMAIFTSPGDGKAHGIVTSIATSQGPVTAYFSLRDFSGKAVLEAKSIYGRLPDKVLDELRSAEKAGNLAYKNKAAFEAWAAQTAGAVSDAALPAPPNLEDLRQLFAADTASQDSDPALSLGPTRNAESLDGDTAAEILDPETKAQMDRGTAFSLRPEKMPEIFAGLAELPQVMRDVRGSGQVKAVKGQIVGKPLTNLATGMIATVSGESLHKMLSSSAVLRSVSPQAHMMALGNIDHLFHLAILEQTRDGKKDIDENRIAGIHHLIAPLPFEDQVLEVRIMAKEFVNPAYGNRLYLIQAAKIVTPASLTGEASSPKDEREPHRPAGVEETFARMVDSVKRGPQKD